MPTSVSRAPATSAPPTEGTDAQNPAKRGAWIGKRLQKTAQRLPAMRSRKRSAAYGHGLVSVARALL